MSDAEKVHRWITQAELDAMLEAARSQGRQEAIEDSPTLSQYRDAIHAAKMLEDENRRMHAVVAMAEHQRDAAIDGEQVWLAYLRGAEAMRTAAADLVQDMRNVPNARTNKVVAAIRALPVPEDKP